MTRATSKRPPLAGHMDINDVQYQWLIAPHYPGPAFETDSQGCAPLLAAIIPEPPDEEVRAIIATLAEQAARKIWE